MGVKGNFDGFYFGGVNFTGAWFKRCSIQGAYMDRANVENCSGLENVEASHLIVKKSDVEKPVANNKFRNTGEVLREYIDEKHKDKYDEVTIFTIVPKDWGCPLTASHKINNPN